MNFKSTRLGLAAAGAVATMGLAAGPAMAHITPQPVRGTHSAILTPGKLTASGLTSPYLGGYVGQPTEGFSSITTTFKIPSTIACSNSSDYEEILLGTWLTPNGTVGWESGYDAAAAAVARCQGNGVIQVYAYTDVGGAANYGAAVNPGDTVVARIAVTNNAQTVATVNDLTNRASESTQFNSTPVDTEYQIGVEPDPDIESGTAIPYLPNVTFGQADINGAYLSTDRSLTRYKLKQGSTVQITPSSLSPLTLKNSFTDTENSTS